MPEIFEISSNSLGSSTANFVCPNCNVHSLHQLQMPASPIYGKKRPTNQTDPIFDLSTQHCIYRCVNCAQDTYFFLLIFDGGKRLVQHQWPVVSPSMDPSVSSDIRNPALEASKCLSVRAYNACGVMTRRAIHAICKDKKAKGSDLFSQLKFLRDQHMITPDLWEWAEELRIVGRSGAHPEWEEVTVDDAEYAVKFLGEIVRYLYINPAERATKRLKETKIKRKTKK